MSQYNTLARETDPREEAGRVAALSDEEQVRAVMNALAPEDAARLVAHAPGIEAQTRLVWSLSKPRRAAMLDHLSAVTVAAIIQNKEGRNRRLLGDLSLAQFAAILRFCHPRQRYYWITLANSFADAGANLLVLLLSPDDVASALMTVPELRGKLGTLRRWVTTFLGAGGFETEPPVRDRKLRAILTRLASYSPERCVEVLDAAARMPPEETSGPDIPANFYPKLPAPELPRVPVIPPLVPRPAQTEGEAPAEPGGQQTEGEAPAEPGGHGRETGPIRDTVGDAPAEPAPPAQLVPLALPADSLVRLAASGLPPACRERLESSMEKMLHEEAMAEGGSLAQRDLERVAQRIQAYVRLGLQGVPEEPEAVAEVLRSVRFEEIVERGAVALEQLRQVAYKLRPFTAVLDAGQRNLLADLADLHATVHPGTGAPALLIRTPGRRGFRPVPVTEVQERLADVSLWVAVSRALGIRELSERLASRTNGSLGVLAALGVSLLRHGRWDPQVLGEDGLREFRAQHFDAAGKRYLPDTAERLREALDAWMEHVRLEPAMRPRFTARVLDAMAHLERYLRGSATPSWDRFTPGGG